MDGVTPYLPSHGIEFGALVTPGPPGAHAGGKGARPTVFGRETPPARRPEPPSARPKKGSPLRTAPGPRPGSPKGSSGAVAPVPPPRGRAPPPPRPPPL